MVGTRYEVGYVRAKRGKHYLLILAKIRADVLATESNIRPGKSAQILIRSYAQIAAKMLDSDTPFALS